MTVKKYFPKAADYSVYPGVKKFHQNHSILHCFCDKCVFAFLAEI